MGGARTQSRPRHPEGWRSGPAGWTCTDLQEAQERDQRWGPEDQRCHLVQVHNVDSPSLLLLLFATSLWARASFSVTGWKVKPSGSVNGFTCEEQNRFFRNNFSYFCNLDSVFLLYRFNRRQAAFLLPLGP